MVGISAEIIFGFVLAAKDEKVERQTAQQIAQTGTNVAIVTNFLADRTITDENSNRFILMMRDYPKMPVRVFVGIEDYETLKYAKKIRQLLDNAGYSVKTSNGSRVFNERVVELGVGNIDFTNPRNSDTNYGVFMIRYGTDYAADFVDVITGLALTKDGRIVETTTNPITTFEVLKLGLDRIGLNPCWTSDDRILKPGEFGILVPEKPR
jgi:hypothetical protein